VGCCSEAHGDLHSAVREGGEEYCQAVVPGQAVCARVYREEQQSESRQVKESSMPVGFVEIIYVNYIYLIEHIFYNFDPFLLTHAAH
jgi:hypothetical protein